MVAPARGGTVAGSDRPSISEQGSDPPMSSTQANKIFGAILLAGVIAMGTGFLSQLLVHPHELEEAAYVVEGVERAAEGPAETVIETILPLLASADVAKGERLSRQCASCHSFNEGGPNRVGPNLWNIVASDKARNEAFNYSSALAGMEGDWDYSSLNQFLYKPREYVVGTKMSYAGLSKVEDRANLVAWLRTLASSPAPLPTQEEIEAATASPEGEGEGETEAAETAGDVAETETVEDGAETSEEMTAETEAEAAGAAAEEEGEARAEGGTAEAAASEESTELEAVPEEEREATEEAPAAATAASPSSAPSPAPTPAPVTQPQTAIMPENEAEAGGADGSPRG